MANGKLVTGEKFNKATINLWQQQLQAEAAMDLVEFAYSTDGFSNAKNDSKEATINYG